MGSKKIIAIVIGIIVLVLLAFWLGASGKDDGNDRVIELEQQVITLKGQVDDIVEENLELAKSEYSHKQAITELEDSLKLERISKDNLNRYYENKINSISEYSVSELQGYFTTRYPDPGLGSDTLKVPGN